MDWEERVKSLWARIDELSERDFVLQMESLVGELPADSPIGMFELGGCFDSMGYTDRAVPLYRRALAGGLSGSRRRQAVIQLASSLRNLGKADESVALLTEEKDRESSDLDDAVRAFMALALVDLGREREAVAIALTALSGHMTRYRRSLINYAQALLPVQPD